MRSNPQQQKIYRDAVAGLPRIVEAISQLPTKRQPEALEAVERSYRQTISDLGLSQPDAAKMVAALMRRLLRRVAKRGSVRDKVLRALQEELVGPEPKADAKPARPRKSRRRRLPKPTLAPEAHPIEDETSSQQEELPSGASSEKKHTTVPTAD
jgi:hypothetical protein